MRIALFALLILLTGCGAPNSDSDSNAQCTHDGCFSDLDYVSEYQNEAAELQAYACRANPEDANCCSDDPADPRPYCTSPY